MLIEKDPDILQFVLEALAKAGQECGLELHLGKTFLLPIRHGGSVHGGDGKAITHKASAVYLGGLLCADGQPGAEVSRRIGEAWRAYLQLERVWRHANITRGREIDLYVGCIIPKVMYGLESLWLRQAERKRLDECLASRIRTFPKSQIKKYCRELMQTR